MNMLVILMIAVLDSVPPPSLLAPPARPGVIQVPGPDPTIPIQEDVATDTLDLRRPKHRRKSTNQFVLGITKSR